MKRSSRQNVSKSKENRISAGERSEIRTENVEINNANIAVASKDLSKLSIKNIDIRRKLLQQLIKNQNMVRFLLNKLKSIPKYLSFEKRSIIKVNDETIKSTDLNYAAFKLCYN